MKTKIALYKTKGGWHWRMTDVRNGKIIGASTESYKRRIDCVRNLDRVGKVGVHSWPAAHAKGDWDFVHHALT